MMVWVEIGKRIKKLRNDKKMTQKQFGNLIHKSSQYIGKIEKGQKISVETIVAICKKTEVTIDYVIFGIAEPVNMDFLNDFSPEQIEICLGILKKIADLIKTPKGNMLLINELMRRQYQKQVK